MRQNTSIASWYKRFKSHSTAKWKYVIYQSGGVPSTAKLKIVKLIKGTEMGGHQEIIPAGQFQSTKSVKYNHLIFPKN